MNDLSGFEDWAPKLWTKLDRRRRARLLLRRVVALTAVFLALGGIVTGFLLLQATPAHSNRSAASAANGAARTPAADPFRATAADSFTAGAAGIVTPPARVSGSFTADQVAGALAKAKTLLVEQNLDPRVESGDLEALRDAIAPPQAFDLADQLSARGPVAGLLRYASRVAAGVKGPTATPRVRGSITYAGGVDRLDVRANYVFVYPLATASGSRLVVVHREETFEFFRPGTVRPGDEGPYLVASQVTSYSSDCQAEQGGLLKPDLSGPAGPDAVDDRDPSFEARYDPATPQATRTCSPGRIA